MDYEKFFEERGVRFITDIWGVQHDVSPGSEPLMILTEGQYKGYSYFNKTGTIADWEEYWYQFKKYNHCFGIAKWQFDSDIEPLMTRGNYQILQDLELTYDEFKTLATPSIDWFEKITDGDPVYTYCFLGMFADKHKALNDYCAAILKNPAMLQEEGVRTYIVNLLSKYRDDMKCGKIWLPGSFKFLAPDLIMLMEHIGGLPLEGALGADEFYCFDRRGVMNGERLIERNPHICKSEHVILNATNSPLLEKYCSHLVNVCMLNCKSITPQRLNGADRQWSGAVVTQHLERGGSIAGINREPFRSRTDTGWRTVEEIHPGFLRWKNTYTDSKTEKFHPCKSRRGRVCSRNQYHLRCNASVWSKAYDPC